MKSNKLVLFAALLLPSSVWSQRVQNMDISFLYGPLPVKSSTVPGTSLATNGTTGLSSATGYGYQIKRTAAGSLWIDVATVFGLHANSSAGVPGRINNGFSSITAGLRWMVPVTARVSFYGTTGGGVGSFNYSTLSAEAPLAISSRPAGHGVWELGGGLDLRLTRQISVRGEVRDLVTASGLSGSTGHHRLVPLFGVALHF